MYRRFPMSTEHIEGLDLSLIFVKERYLQLADQLLFYVFYFLHALILFLTLNFISVHTCAFNYKIFMII